MSNPTFSSLSSDRSGIVEVGAVELLQENLIKALRSLITSRRPDDSTLFPKLLLRLPDLRTLNNQHSDKLLAFRIDPWIQMACSLLRYLLRGTSWLPMQAWPATYSTLASAWRTGVVGAVPSLMLWDSGLGKNISEGWRHSRRWKLLNSSWSLLQLLPDLQKKKKLKHSLCSSMGSSSQHQTTTSSPLPPRVRLRQHLFWRPKRKRGLFVPHETLSSYPGLQSKQEGSTYSCPEQKEYVKTFTNNDFLLYIHATSVKCTFHTLRNLLHQYII